MLVRAAGELRGKLDDVLVLRLGLLLALAAGCGRVDFDQVAALTDADADAPVDPNAVVELAVGGKASCARLQSGKVWCWGSNSSGLLGAGFGGAFSPLPLPVLTVDQVVELEVDDGGGCARLANGGAIGWGSNDRGQLGTGDTTMHAIPTLIGATDVAGFTMATSTMCVRHADGTVACAGGGAEGALGDGSVSDRAAFGDVPGVVDVGALTSGTSHVCALLADGSVRSWGRNSFGQLGDGSMTLRRTPVSGPVGPYTAIGAGDDFTCGLRRDRSIECWGADDNKQLGDDLGVPQATPVPIVGIADVTAIAVGANHVCALRSDRSVACWGGNSRGQLGDGSFVSSATPRALPLADVVEIRSRTDVSTCARTGDGAVWCWGENAAGEIGDGTSGGTKVRPTRVIGLP